MIPRFVPAILLAIVAPASFASQPDGPKMSKQTRMDLTRAFNAELVYIRSPFPMGKKGLTIKDGAVTPSGQELEQMMALWGPATKPGDRAMITDIRIKDDRIHFEINGGPIKRKKWYQRIEVGGMGGTTPIAPSDPQANPRGSFVDLVFDRYVPELNPDELKELLRPVFDFNAKSAVDAYLETVPPVVKDAIKEHRVLVGMNREMVIYSKGRAPKKVRERQGENEYEEWIYGEPPRDVDFVRFVGDEVVRVETMKVNGEKELRTEKEVELESAAAVAKGPESPDETPSKAPSLRRPGEQPEIDSPSDGPDRPQRPMPPPDPPPGGPQVVEAAPLTISLSSRNLL
jgi:hypothetical protein